MAGSHPDVVSGERDGAESPALLGTLTGWATFAGIVQTAQVLPKEPSLVSRSLGERRVLQF